ncbi:MAG: short-chain fatty acyl-CoA regulator family protein [Sphingomonadaceae bacterium]
MADRLSISASYLNLIERNQRPVTARVLVQVVDQFEFDPRALREDESIGGVDGLARRLADERFSDLAVDRDEVAEFLANAPHAAAAFVRLYDDAGPGTARPDDPLSACQLEVERWRNHFADLDSASETLADELRLSRSDIAAAILERLRDEHQISLRILPEDIMPDDLSRIDLHARQLQVNEMLDCADRLFEMAIQLSWLEHRQLIRSLASGSKFPDDTSRALFERHLASYAAHALIMPYGRFLRACEATGYDLDILQRRFSCSLAHLAFRLTSLQRVGQRGLPFAMLEFDAAAQFVTGHAGASGANFVDGGGRCPKWPCFMADGANSALAVAAVEVESGAAGPACWLMIAGRVAKPMGAGLRTILLCLDAKLAGDIAASRGISLRQDDAVKAGAGCWRCHRPACRQRIAPPSGANLSLDSFRRSATFWTFGQTG